MLLHCPFISDVRLHHRGTRSIEGIKLDMLEPEELFIGSKTIKNVKKLRLVVLRDIHISGWPENLLNEINWLDAHVNGQSECSGLPAQKQQSDEVKTISLKFKSIKVASRKFLSLMSAPVVVKATAILNHQIAFLSLSMDCQNFVKER